MVGQRLSIHRLPQTLFIERMSGRKFMQLSHSKKPVPKEEPPRQSHSSLDKVDKKQPSFKVANTLQQRKSNGLIFKFEDKPEAEKKEGVNEEWPSSNKRKYLKNYQLPKINSPTKLKKEDVSKYEAEPNENLIEDEEKLSFQKKSMTLDSPTKKLRLLPLRNTNYPTAVRTKPGTNGKQTKINQDIAIVEQKLPHNLKLYCICDGHGLNGHLVSAFIKTTLIKNLTAPLKKLHNHPDKDKLIEIIYLALQTTNQQLLDCEINTELAGSTLVAVFLYQDKLLVFNVGDSRAIVLQQQETNICKEEETDPSKFPQLSNVKSKEEYEWIAYPLSIDQKPDRPDEKQRIIKNGGRVFAQTNETGDELGPARVWMKDVMMPGLAMSRSFGDKAGIKAGTNAEPELIEHTIEDTDKLIIVASDGIWQYLENEDVMKIVSPFLLKDDLNGAADLLMKRGVETWAKMNYARDDITFILIKLNNPEK